MPTRDEMRETIKRYVLDQRRRQGLTTVDTKVKPEPSGEMFGEFALLLDIQLLTTAVGHGGWLELDHVPTLKGVYQEVMKRGGLH